MVSDVRHLENKEEITFVQNLVKCGQGDDKYYDGHFGRQCETLVRLGVDGTLTVVEVRNPGS